jgi:hypothetical protein
MQMLTPNLLDTANLHMLIGLKKWARRKKNRALVDKATKEYEIRMARELPRPLFVDIINDCMPIVSAYAQAYKAQLGEKHGFAVASAQHEEKLKQRVRNQGYTADALPTEEEESAAANAMAIK